MPKKSRFFSGGFIDILSLVAVVFLVISAVTATVAVNNRKANYNIQEKAACMDPCTLDTDCASGEYCYRPVTGCSICKVKTSTPVPTAIPTTTTVIYTCTQTSGQYCSRDCSYSAGSGSCQTGQVCCKEAPAPTQSPSPTPTQVPQCSSSQIKCTGSGQLYSCYSGSWILDVRCPSQICNSTGTACGTAPTPSPTPIPTYTCTQTSGQYCSRDCTYGSGSGTCQTGQVCCKPADPNLVCSTQGQVKCVGSQLYNCSSGYWYPGANCASGSCNATGTACTPLASCITTNGLGSTRCKTTSTASYVETCLSTGTWSITSACSGTCTNGVCSNCADKPNICNGEGGVNYCSNGSYVSKKCDIGTTCSEGVCITPTGCIARDVCLKDGQTCCPGLNKVRGSGCSSGLKCGSCLAGQTRCGGSGTSSYSETCQTDDTWTKSPPCQYGCSEVNGKCIIPLLSNGTYCKLNSECKSGKCIRFTPNAEILNNQICADNEAQAAILADANNIKNIASSPNTWVQIALATTAVGLTQNPATAQYIQPVVQNAMNLLPAAFGALTIYDCQKYGTNSTQCINEVGGTYATYQMAVYQQMIQGATANPADWWNPFGDTSGFRLTNAPTMNGSSLGNTLESVGNPPANLSPEQLTNVLMAKNMNTYFQQQGINLSVETKNGTYPYQINSFFNEDQTNPILKLWAGSTDTELLNQIAPGSIGKACQAADCIPLIKDIMIKPQFRGQGYGGAIVDAFGNAARDVGLDTIGITNISNQEALNFWLNQGFITPESQIGRTLPYFMTKPLIP